MEKIVLVIGGLLKTLTWSDLFFFFASLILIHLMIYIIYLVKCENTEQSSKKEEIKETTSLKDIVDKLETNYEPKPIDLTDYERELENTAIISYDELVKRSNNNISYEDEYDSGYEDLTVRKVTTDSNTKELVNLPKAIMMSYENEEAFLHALETLQDNLVR